MSNLTEYQRQHMVEVLERGEDLPPDYKHLLFPPERDFVRQLIKPENAQVIDAWIKSTDRDFYPIEYAWRKGEHHKRARFNPDFFIKKDNHILVLEIKGDEEVREPADDSRAKYRHAREHFETLNQHQDERRYLFHFLTPRDYDTFFKFLRENNYGSFVSSLDAELGENSEH